MSVTGCTTTDTGVSASVSSNVAPAQAVPVETLDGGLVERAGVSLLPADRASALRAEQYALASVPAGESVSWQGRDAEGRVTAASPYQVGDQNCRQYTQRVIVKGQEYVGRGAACRGQDGLWTLLN
nr:hypothetical protein [Martelella radicis]